MAAESGSSGDGKEYERGYLFRTLRSTAFVATFVMLVLAAYGLTRLVAPFAVGVGLASVLLWGLNLFVRNIFTPKPRGLSDEEKKKGDRKKAGLIALALVKYPLVGLLIWAIVRAWGHDTARMIAFVGGFLVLQIVIALRAVAKAVTTKPDKL